jgi:hypothetical protein
MPPVDAESDFALIETFPWPIPLARRGGHEKTHRPLRSHPPPGPVRAESEGNQVMNIRRGFLEFGLDQFDLGLSDRRYLFSDAQKYFRPIRLAVAGSEFRVSGHRLTKHRKGGSRLVPCTGKTRGSEDRERRPARSNPATRLRAVTFRNARFRRCRQIRTMAS